MLVCDRFVAGTLGNTLFTVEELVIRTGNAFKTVPERFRRVYFYARVADIVLVWNWSCIWALTCAVTSFPIHGLTILYITILYTSYAQIIEKFWGLGWTGGDTLPQVAVPVRQPGGTGDARGTVPVLVVLARGTEL